MSNWEHEVVGVDWTDFKLADRELVFQKLVKGAGYDFEEPPYVVLWEDPADQEAPCRITMPSPCWWAMALHGNILPPVEVYWALAEDEAKPDFKRHTRGHLLHETTPLGPMTEEEAMSYLIQQIVPTRVWRDYEGNRTILKIVPRELIPTDRHYRNAWQIDQGLIEEEAA